MSADRNKYRWKYFGHSIEPDAARYIASDLQG
jgi:hypothetical protein